MTDLQELIGLRKGDRSYEQLSRASGGVITRQRMQALATAPMRAFPDPDTIRALSRALSVAETTVVLAAATSVGLNVRGPSGWEAFLPAGVERIPEHMRNAILSVVHSAMHMTLEEVMPGGQDPRQEAEESAPANITRLPRRVTKAARHGTIANDPDQP